MDNKDKLPGPSYREYLAVKGSRRGKSTGGNPLETFWHQRSQKDDLKEFEERLARDSINISFNEFCERLYEVLWRHREPYNSPQHIVDDFIHYYKHKNERLPRLCPITFAIKNGYKCFEELLHSPELNHVVTIEESRYPEHPTQKFRRFRYRVALNPDRFQDIRRNIKPRRRDIYVPRNAPAPVPYPPGPVQEVPKKAFEGELFKYECDVSEGVGWGEEEESEQTDYNYYHQQKDEDGKYDEHYDYGQGECSSSSGKSRGIDKMMEKCKLEEDHSSMKAQMNSSKYKCSFGSGAPRGSNKKNDSNLNDPSTTIVKKNANKKF